MKIHASGHVRGGVIAFETAVGIDRPVEEVFAYVADPRNLPAWNSAVQEVRPAGGPAYTMRRQLPAGSATNRLEVVARTPPHEFAIRATAGPTPFLYRYGFAAAGGGTVVRLAAEIELDGLATLAPQLARIAVRRGVDANLATLKSILEEWPARRAGAA
jgi:uncharacterized protein YndB with AHSA1/START domain